MNEPKIPHVAIIIANYNYGHWLLGAVKSAAAQDYPNKVIVVSSDGSTDNSLEVIQQASVNFVKAMEDEIKCVYSGFIDNVQIVYIDLKQNGGPSRARNQAIQLMWNSDVFSILDADDFLMPTKVSKCVAAIIDGQGLVGGVYTDYFIKDEQTGTTTYESKAPWDYFELQRYCLTHSGMTYTKQALEKCGGYPQNQRVAEDYFVALKVSNHFVISHIAEPLVLVRNHINNSTHSVPKEVWDRDMTTLRQSMNK